jgi:hypothetical protein
MTEPEQWREAVTEVIAHLLTYPGRSENPWLRNFPEGSCSITSFAVGRLLLERYGQQWLLVSGASEDASTHTWLVRDESAGATASIDATLHQFPDLGEEAFVGWGPSPAESRFHNPIGFPVYVALVDGDWHHGQTIEVYEWLFPRLELRPFNPTESLRNLMPADLAYPPVTRLVDAMAESAALPSDEHAYAIVVSQKASSALLRNSDAGLGRYSQERDRYLSLPVIALQQVPDDSVILLPTKESSEDAMSAVGSIASGRFSCVSRSELDKWFRDDEPL